MDIASWLRQMGLEQYEPVFRAHAIDGSVLPSLTAEDLKDLGVELVGHRRKLLDAIAALHTGPTPVSGQQATMPAGAERRHLFLLNQCGHRRAVAARRRTGLAARNCSPAGHRSQRSLRLHSFHLPERWCHALLSDVSVGRHAPVVVQDFGRRWHAVGGNTSDPG